MNDDRRRFSMIRSFSLADLITLGNGFAGTGAVFASMSFMKSQDTRHLWLAFGLLPIAMIMDFADGRVARWRHKASPLGQDLDSLADLVSFGVAPASIAFAVGLQGGWDVAALIYFVGCGISRLARYNITASSLSDDSGKVRHFEGTPIPTSVVMVGVFAALTARGEIGAALPFGAVHWGPYDLHPLVLMYVLSGSLMISKLKLPKF